jgi:hypothetical protein
MKKRLLNRKRLMQLALSLYLILVSANSSWGQSITVPNGDFSAGNVFLTGTNPYTVISGWTVNAATTAGVNNLTTSASGVVGGALYLKGTASGSAGDVLATSIPNNDVIQCIDISAIPLGATFTAIVPMKAGTSQSQTPHQTRIKLYDANGLDVTAACTANAINTGVAISTTSYTNQQSVLVTQANNLTGGLNAKYIAVQASVGKNLLAGVYIDNVLLSYTSNPPVITVGTPTSTALTYEYGQGPSAAESFTVGGTNMTGNLVLTPGTNIELSSTSATSGFLGGGGALSLAPTSGTLSTTTIYARLVAGISLGSAGANGARTVTMTTSGATPQSILYTCSVTGFNPGVTSGLALSYDAGNGPSAEQSFAFSSNVTGNIVVTPGYNLEVSSTTGSGFHSSPLTLSPGGYTIYTRLKAGLSAGNYNDTSTLVEVSSTGFTSFTKQFTGTIPTTWDGISWSNTIGPTTSIDAIIDGNFSTSASGVTAGFTAKTLTVNATRSFNINSGHNITVAGAITNNGTITIENNANLVQTAVANTNSGSGTTIVKRNSASIQLFDYTLWSSPVIGQNLKAFSPETLDSRFYTYNSSTNQYNVVTTSLITTPFSPATGYLIRAPNTWAAATPNTFNGVFTGVPNNGNISLSASALASDKFYAVGNPYPSTISADLFLNGNATGGTLYFWRKINNATTTPTTSYATYTLAGGVGTGTPNSGDSSSITPNGTIQVGQGFIVKTGPLATTLNFTNAMRTANNVNQFLRTTENRSRFWLNLTSTTGAFCQTMVAYMPEATSGVDNAIDGRYFNDSPIALTSIINAEEYTIQGRAMPFSTLDTVPLGFKTDAAGNYTIAIDHVDGLFSSGQAIYLKDNLLNTVNDISAGSYSFASAIGTFNSRFEVVYQSTLAETNPTFTANSVIAFSENGEIKINSGSTIMELVRVYDLQGRLLVEKKQINSSETKLSTTATNQVLLLEITAANGLKVTKKIIQ